MSRRVLFLNGPNINMLGKREPHIYGKTSLADVEAAVRRRAADLDVTIDFRQTNEQGELVTWIQQAREGADLIILNAGAYTHTSVAVHDALNAAEKPVIELHLSNNFRREEFRHLSYVSSAARGIIEGFGAQGYLNALDAAARLLDRPDGGL
jgi:3-dehydroquinate dehydratase-2